MDIECIYITLDTVYIPYLVMFDMASNVGMHRSHIDIGYPLRY